MKKTLWLLGAALLAMPFAGLAQDEEEKNISLRIIPRLDANPYVAFSDDGYSGYDWGASGLYTLFEGSIGEHFSYSLCNHWLSGDPGSLYTNTWHTDASTWCDWAKVTFSAGIFEATAGKMAIGIGTFEFDDYDFDSHYNLNSISWYNSCCYQYGVQAGVNLGVSDDGEEGTYLGLQWCTSPYAARPFTGDYYAYSLYVNSVAGSNTNISSFNALRYDDDSYMFMLTLGDRYSFGDFDLTLDVVAMSTDIRRLFSTNYTASLMGTYRFGDKVDLNLKAGYEYLKEDILGTYDPIEGGFVPSGILPGKADMSYFFGGIACHYYPIDNLRVHAVVASNTAAKALSLNVGVTYDFDIFDLF